MPALVHFILPVYIFVKRAILQPILRRMLIFDGKPPVCMTDLFFPVKSTLEANIVKINIHL